MALIVLIGTSLVLLTTLFHFAVLRVLSGQMAQIEMNNSLRILVMIFVAFGAHIVEISLYAVAYALVVLLELGTFGGATISTPLDYFYFSIVSFTSLGIGDVFPDGHLRFIAGIEALNGLLLIAWTGSFIFLAMGHLWPWQNCKEPPRKSKLE